MSDFAQIPGEGPRIPEVLSSAENRLEWTIQLKQLEVDPAWQILNSFWKCYALTSLVFTSTCLFD